MATGERTVSMRRGAARLAMVAMMTAGALALTCGAAAAQSYTVTDLGTLGGRQSTGVALNNAGQVAGDSWMAGNTTQHSVVWSDGIMLDITGTYSVAHAMNAAGQVTGEAFIDGGMHAFISSNGVVTDLGYFADNGASFRVSDCQYIYNLAASSLGAGRYRVEIAIDGRIVGQAEFSLR